jgi:hypothetical protein
MALAFDAKGGGNTSFANSLTFAHTCTGTSLGIFVGIGSGTGSNDFTGVTYNTVSLSIDRTDFSAGQSTWIWDLINPATGSPHNIVISKTGNAAFGAISASFTGVDQTTITDSDAGGNNAFQTSPRSDNITVSSGGVAFDVFWKQGADNCTAGGSQTDTANHQNDTAGITNASYLAAATAMSWAFTTDSHIGHSIVAIKAAAGAAAQPKISSPILQAINRAATF